jgi:hypothetical protein
MKKILFATIIIGLALGLLLVTANRRHDAVMRQAVLKAESHAAELRKTAATKMVNGSKELDEQMRDPKVSTSILKGLKISLEIQPQWKQGQEFILQINLEKPLGEKFLVDAVTESCLLYVNNHPKNLLRQDGSRVDSRELLEENLGSSHPVFRITPDIPDRAELMLEWINYNPRTGEIEKLRSEPYVWNRSVNQAQLKRDQLIRDE